ncbi:MAG: hypothetical protein R2844_00500 [Caldilineales bacterium]
MDYAPDDTLLVMDDGAEFMTLVSELEAQAAQTQRDLVTGGDLPANPLPPHLTWAQVKPLLESRRPILLGHGDLQGRTAPGASPLARHFVPGPRYGGQVKQIVADVAKARQAGTITVLVTRQAPRLADLLEEAGQTVAVDEEVLQAPPARALRLVKGVLDEGWVLRGLPAGSLHLYSDAELFGWTKPSRRRV